VLARTCFVQCCAVRCVDTFYRNCQPSTLDRPGSSQNLRQDRTGLRSLFQITLFMPQNWLREEDSSSFVLRPSSSPKAAFKLALLPTSSCDPRLSPNLTHAPVSTVEKQSSKSPTLLPLPDYKILPFHVHRKLHGAFLSPIDSHASQKLRHPVVIDHEHLRVQGPARLSGNGSLL
jgi:hypothetical protein